MNILAEYDKSYYFRRENSPTFQAEVRAIVEALEPISVDHILELGCGSGALLRRLVHHGCSLIVGLDWLNISASLILEHRAGVLPVLGNAAHLPFANDSFDKVVAQHLIEHFEDPQGAISRWKHVLRPGGKLVLVTPNRHFPHQEWFDDPSHQHIFCPEELASCVASAGLVVEGLEMINPFFFHLRFSFLAARRMQFLSRFPYFARRSMSILIRARKPTV